jgi:hypothetical protein
METLRSLRLLEKPGDHRVSFDFKDGFSSIAINPKDREAYAVSLDMPLLYLCPLPIGWSLSKPIRISKAHGSLHGPPPPVVFFPVTLGDSKRVPKAFIR